MHLAVCDDHIADRKQTERLLGRESDRRLRTTGVLYVDSFGSKNSILTTPMFYDAIFMDMTEEGCDAVELANMLRADGTEVPIIFCCGKVNYRTRTDLPANVLFLDKPIQTDELAAIVDQLLTVTESKTKKFEFRNDTETFYFEEEELMYAFPEDRFIRIHMNNGDEKLAVTNLKTFCANLDLCDSYLLVNDTYVVNMTYIRTVNFFRLTMVDGKEFRIGFGEMKRLRHFIEEFRRQQKN